MPADFQTPITSPLTRLRALTSGATTFASDVVALLTAAFGANNPFGTAATRNTGTAEGDVPLVGSDGRIDAALVPEATETARGGVILARAVTDTRPNVVPTAAQIAAYTAQAATGLDAANLAVTEIADGTSFSPPAIGLIVIGAAGGGGHRPPASRQDYLTDGAGTSAANSYLYYGPDVANNAANTRVEVRGGLGGTVSGAARPGNRGIYIATPPQAVGRPAFSFILQSKGAQGGVAGFYGEGTAQTEYAGVPGQDGELLIAKVDANRQYRVVIGAPGTGGAALTGLPTGRRSVAGGNGFSGFAFYMRLA